MVSGGGGANPSENPGLARWFGVLRVYPLPSDAPAAVKELEVASDEIEKVVGATLGAAQAYHSAACAMADAAGSLRDAVNGYCAAAGDGSAARPSSSSLSSYCSR